MQRRAFEVSPYRTAVSVALVLVGMLVLAVTPAVAGIGGSDVPTWPVSATVGDIINVSITIVNGSTTPNNTENVVVENFSVNPSCKSSANAICLGGNVDPGVFHILAGGQGTGAAGTACPGTVFDISPPFPDGGLVLTPQGTVTLGSTASGVNLTCTVNFSLRVFKMPANPTTNALTGVQLHGANSGLQGLGTGSAQITIAKATPTLETTSSPNAGNVVPGTAVSDSVTLTKAPGAVLPTGSVRFILCQPGDVNVTGCPSPKGQKIGDDKPLGVAPISATSDSTTDTLAIGTYCWRARYLGDANYNAVNHTDAVAECFTTAKQPVTVTTLSNPTGGNVTPGSVVKDAVTVTGGPGQPTPTGTVTWFLCQPNEVTGQGCVSPAGTQIGPVKTLNPFGIRISGGTTNTLTDGQYCWRVEYSGDGVYVSSSHTDTSNECFTVQTASLVQCPKPNAQFALGAAAQFAILELDGGALTIGTGATKISGPVGIGDNSTGSDLIKATIDGPLLVDCNASNINIHADLTATCGIAAKPPLNRAPFTDCVELDTQVQDALDASTALADTILNPTDQTFPDITANATIVATHDGLNVISVTGEITLIGETLAFDASTFSNVAFVVNVQGGLTCSNCTVTVNAPLNFGDVLFNFPGSGADASVKGPSSTFSGTLLGPQRNCTLDKGQLTGAILCGGGILVHSAAQLCPGFDFVCQ